MGAAITNIWTRRVQLLPTFEPDGYSYYQPLGLSPKRGVFLTQKNVQNPNDNDWSLSLRQWEGVV